MMVPETLCERWNNVLLIARKDETIAFWYTTEFRAIFLHTFGSMQLLSSHPDLPQLFEWRYCFHLSSSHKNRDFSGMSVWGSPALCDSSARSFQGRAEILTWSWKLCSPVRTPLHPWAVKSCCSLSILFPDLCIALPCSTLMNLCIPTTALESCSSCFLQTFPRTANATAWLPTDQQILPVVGSGLLLRIMCWNVGVHTTLG